MPALTHTPRSILLLSLLLLAMLATSAAARAPAALARVTGGSSAGTASQPPSNTADSLESAASRAGDTGRKVAMSLIGLGFAIAAIVLSFRRDFKEAAGVFAVGIVAILLATPVGMRLLQDTVTSLFGAQ